MPEAEDNEAVDGVMITIGDADFFVPQSDLQDYRLSKEASDAYRSASSDEVEGFELRNLPGEGMLQGVRFDRHEPDTVAFSSLMAHGLTAVKNQ